MFEHVGVNHYDAYFRKIADLLDDDGVALIHSIGRSDGPGVTNPWIHHYIFPGGYSPALSEVLPAIERAGLIVTDVEILRLHYAETLKRWRERFNQNRVAHPRRSTTSASAGCGSSIWRPPRRPSAGAATWCSRSSCRKRIDAVPLTRDYIGEAERRLPLDLMPIRVREAAE